MSAVKTKVRIQLDFDEEAAGMLDDLVKRGQYKSRADVIRRALSLLELYVSEKEKGSELLIRNGDTVERIRIL